MPRLSRGLFTPGESGACEAILYEFSNTHSNRGADDAALDPEKTTATTHRIAAASMLEAITYMAGYEPLFHIRSVRMLGVIVLLSGSSYN